MEILLFKYVTLFFTRLKYKTAYFFTSFFKTDEHQELLNKVDTHLLIWNHTLLNLATGEQVALVDMNADTLAIAAKEIVPKSKQILHITLYLPNIEFVATEYGLPGVALQNITSALAFQTEELMPAYPGKLMLAVNHDESYEKNMALWLDHTKTEAISLAFKEHSLELTCIIPRIMLASLMKNSSIKKQPTLQFREHDENNLLQITLKNKHLSQWYAISNFDINDENYYRKWEYQSELLTDSPLINTVDFWKQPDKHHFEKFNYAFFPDSALHNLKKRSRLKKGRLAIITGIITCILLATPFIKNSIRYKRYEQNYQEYQERTVDVQNMRTSVTQFEDKWALLGDYPKVNAIAVIQKLNTIIPKNSWIKGFQIKEGIVEIDGYSPNPTKLLEVLSKQAEFEHVAFNRRTQAERGKNEHFGITFHLKGIDIEAYQEKYFPVN
ncbi:MAG: PilN domain-containing protein [Bacteroidales bacterium]|nr:PilN domain-containing protein [Bacteroidales bacterium]